MISSRIAPLTLLSVLLTFNAAPAQSASLKELAKEDQDSRSGKKVARTDQDRVKLVLALIAQDALKVPEDTFNAAPVLQHIGMNFCGKRLVSDSPDNYLLTHELFKSAFAAGYSDARYLVAASLDRYLSFTQGHQKYGTNRVFNQKSGKEELVPIDRKTSDAERAQYGVPPLAQLLKQYPEQRPPKTQEPRLCRHPAVSGLKRHCGRGPHSVSRVAI